MRILHVLPTLSPNYGGPPKACMDMAKIMVERGHDVEIYTINYDGAGEYTSKGGGTTSEIDRVKITEYSIGFSKYRFFSPELFMALYRNVHNFDVVHIHELYTFSSIASGFCSWLKNVPYVFQPHSSLDPYIRRRRRWRKFLHDLLLVRPFVRQAALVQYTTTEEMHASSPYALGRPARVVPLGLYPDEYRSLPARGSFRNRHPDLAGKRIVLFFGRIDPKKGLDILARAFGKVARRHADVHLVVAGPDAHGHRAEVEAWLREEGALDRATFTGMVTGRDKLAVLRDADLFVLSSYMENFGISVVEAMACGLPVLISDKVHIWRDVLATGAGKVAPCEPEPFARLMGEMLDDEIERERCGRRGIEAVRQKFNWSAIGEDLERLYHSVLGTEPPVHAIKRPARAG